MHSPSLRLPGISKETPQKKTYDEFQTRHLMDTYSMRYRYIDLFELSVVKCSWVKCSWVKCSWVKCSEGLSNIVSKHYSMLCRLY
jgi:hypothetical protein